MPGRRPPAARGAGRSAAGVRTPHQNRSWPSTSTTGATSSSSATCRSVNGYGSLGASTTSGRRARTSSSVRSGSGPRRRRRRWRRRARRAATSRRCRPTSSSTAAARSARRPAAGRAGRGHGGVDRGDVGRGRPLGPRGAASIRSAGAHVVDARRSPATARATARRRASASASSSRFSSSHITTRSGASATMAATSGSLVPPTCGRSGCSQNRVHATGVTPQASSVSVTDGTRLTTRACGRARHMRSSSCSSWLRTRPR